MIPSGARPACPAGRRCRVEGVECRWVLPAGRCALALASEGPRGLYEIADLMGISRPLAGDILKSAMRKLRAHADVAALAEFLREK